MVYFIDSFITMITMVYDDFYTGAMEYFACLWLQVYKDNSFKRARDNNDFKKELEKR